MAKRNTSATTNKIFSVLQELEDEYEPDHKVDHSHDSHGRAPAHAVYRENEEEFLLDAIEEIKEFTEYQMLPIAEFLTTENLQTFIREITKSG